MKAPRSPASVSVWTLGPFTKRQAEQDRGQGVVCVWRGRRGDGKKGRYGWQQEGEGEVNCLLVPMPPILPTKYWLWHFRQ